MVRQKLPSMFVKLSEMPQGSNYSETLTVLEALKEHASLRPYRPTLTRGHPISLVA